MENEWTVMDLYFATEPIALSTEKLYNTLKGKKLHASLQELAAIFQTIANKKQKRNANIRHRFAQLV